jgi:site-specific DNA-methyltransferase (adenine-specific)
MNDVHFSSISDEWETPLELFKKFNDIYDFQLDAAATKENALCPNFFSKEFDALQQNWAPYGKVWLNPPYGRQIGKFIKKAYEESVKGCIVVCLIPARTDTKWWYDYVTKSSEIIFITGRIKFINKTLPSYKSDGNFKTSPAPFPSAIVIFDPSILGIPTMICKKQKDL